MWRNKDITLYIIDQSGILLQITSKFSSEYPAVVVICYKAAWAHLLWCHAGDVAVYINSASAGKEEDIYRWQ